MLNCLVKYSYFIILLDNFFNHMKCVVSDSHFHIEVYITQWLFIIIVCLIVFFFCFIHSLIRISGITKYLGNLVLKYSFIILEFFIPYDTRCAIQLIFLQWWPNFFSIFSDWFFSSITLYLDFYFVFEIALMGVNQNVI